MTYIDHLPLADPTGAIVLAGAGKMGGAMLTGWLAGGLDRRPRRRDRPVSVRRDHSARRRGVRINPAAQRHRASRRRRRSR